MGGRNDLKYLSNLLEKNGCRVLKSKVNEKFKSVQGIVTGGESLAKEITDLIKEIPDLRKISFVGNSLGGLYARYAIKVLHDSKTNLVANLEPQNFMVLYSITNLYKCCFFQYIFLIHYNYNIYVMNRR